MNVEIKTEAAQFPFWEFFFFRFFGTVSLQCTLCCGQCSQEVPASALSRAGRNYPHLTKLQFLLLRLRDKIMDEEWTAPENVWSSACQYS